MRIQLKNHHLIPLIPFLRGMKLKGERSRARSKFLALAMEAFTALHESEVELLKEYAVLDGNGNPQPSGDSSPDGERFTLRDAAAAREYHAERDKLFDEMAEIEGGTYTAHLDLMRQILADYDEDLDGENAALYDALCDAFGVGMPQGKEASENAG